MVSASVENNLFVKNRASFNDIFCLATRWPLPSGLTHMERLLGPRTVELPALRAYGLQQSWQQPAVLPNKA
jgi:hypothetical protein